jgi:predicted acetyltransferase
LTQSSADGVATRDIEIRPIAEAEFRAWLDAVEVAFGETITDQQHDEARRIFEVDRVLAAYDGDRCVGGGAAFTFQLAVPGGATVGAAGVTAVGVMPTHRRRGILRRFMRRLLDDARGRGEAVAMLWASEGVIYQRFGYGAASVNGGFDLPKPRAVFRLPAQTTGSVRLIDAAEAARAFPAVYDAVMRETPGFYSRHERWWEDTLADPEHRRRGASAKFYALYERDGVAAGYAMYRVKHEWPAAESRNEVRVLEAFGVDPPAMRAVWSYLFGIDLIDRIVLRLGPPDQPLLLALAQPEMLNLKISDGLWLRLLDIPVALEARSYATDGELVVEVRDEFVPECGGRFRLRASGGRAKVEPTTDGAELLLDTNDLASAYLGGFSFSDLHRAGRGVELVAGARTRADRLFATDRKPWCPQIF